MRSQPSTRARNRSTRLALAAAGLMAVAACENLPLSMGDVHAIVVTGAPELWAEVGPDALATLGPTVFTVRDERTFRVSYQEPTDSAWAGLRRLKQLLLIGKASDPWMATPLADYDEPVAPPGIVQVPEVWGREQLVTLVVLEEETDLEADAAAVRGLLPELWGVFDSQYREWVVARMFATGGDTALARTLRGEHGFGLLVPEVYDYLVQDSVHIFRNDNPDPSVLIRQFAVTWRTPVPEALGTEALLDWRAQIVERYYDYPQVVKLDDMRAGPEEFGGIRAYGVRAVWQNPPGSYPAAGPFITLATVCRPQQRMYLIDAWLYAPSSDKYEYMIQLEEILGSFHCTE